MPAAPATPPTKRQIREQLWRRGIVVEQLGYDHQKVMANVIRTATSRRFVLNCSRRLGKTTTACMIALEYALQRPNMRILFVAPNQKQARNIVLPIMRQVLDTCPKDLKPRFHKNDGLYTFANGSELRIAGSEMEQIDSLRGQACDLALLDEAGFMSDLEYVMESVIGPMMLGRTDARCILLSTPPESPDHKFVTRYMRAALEDDAYVHYTIYDNKSLTPEQIADEIRRCGGEHTTEWRREYLAQVVSEAKNAVFPEATEELMAELTADSPRPLFFLPLTVVDLGYVDHTGVLFGYYDFRRARMVVEDEIFVRQRNSAQLVDLILAKERELWGKLTPKYRFIDAQPQIIADLNELHGFKCAAVAREKDLETAVNRVRLILNGRGIEFNPRCVRLRAQVQYVQWDKRSKFARGGDHHYDLAAALLYFTRHIDTKTNPYPADYGWDHANDWGFARRHANNLHDLVSKLFPVRFKQKDD